MINKKYRKIGISCLCSLTLLLSACTNSSSISNTESEIYVQQEVITSDFIKKDISVPDDTDKQYFNETATDYLISKWEEPLSIYPANYDSGLAFQKDLASKKGEFNDLYFQIQALYRASFETYLVENMDFNEICTQLDNTGFKDVILDVPKEKQDYYAKYSNFTYPYISLRNNIYVEKLEKKDINSLKQIIDNQGVVVTTGSMDIVKNTWDTVMISGDKNENSGFIIEKDIDNKSIIFEIFIPYDIDKNISDIDNQVFEEYLPWFEKQKVKFTNYPIRYIMNMNTFSN